MLMILITDWVLLAVIVTQLTNQWLEQERLKLDVSVEEWMNDADADDAGVVSESPDIPRVRRSRGIYPLLRHGGDR